MSEPNSTVRLKSSDEEIFVVEMTVACIMEAVKNMMVQYVDLGDGLIPLPDVSGKILSKVIEYCRYHVESEKSSEGKPSVPEEEMKQWDAEFVSKLDKATLLDVIVASNCLNIRKLFDLGCEAVGDMISGKTVDEIRKTFGFKNDFTPAVEEAIRSQDE